MAKLITIHDNRDIDNQVDGDSHKHAVATFARALQLVNGSDNSATVYLNNRGVYASEPEWLEHAIVVTYSSGRTLTVGAIQRKPGADSEFHS